MKTVRRVRWVALLVSGSFCGALGPCLPENYFALSIRSLAVNIADSILVGAVTPYLDAFGITDVSLTPEDAGLTASP